MTTAYKFVGCTVLAGMFKHARTSNLFCDIVETLGQIFWLNPPPLNFSIDKNRPPNARLAPVQEMTNTIHCLRIISHPGGLCLALAISLQVAPRMLRQAPLLASLLSLRSVGGQN